MLDVQEVTGSSPVPRTKTTFAGMWFFLLQKMQFFCKKGLQFVFQSAILIRVANEAVQYARLAQLVEHLLDVQEVTGSSPVPRTKDHIRSECGLFLSHTRKRASY